MDGISVTDVIGSTTLDNRVRTFEKSPQQNVQSRGPWHDDDRCALVRKAWWQVGQLRGRLDIV